MDAGGRLARTRATDIGRALDALAYGVVEQDDAIGLSVARRKASAAG